MRGFLELSKENFDFLQKDTAFVKKVAKLCDLRLKYEDRVLEEQALYAFLQRNSPYYEQNYKAVAEVIGADTLVVMLALQLT